ncbi:hypothetical protein HYN69_09270 [Gemmobacter aquarius]|uniref:Lipoprotein n=2 Tax=Paragemmobacter aquarius TaxID=2169400 RepID=A0A2S0ULJ8_9RHOB|nr:hypothetical protein HYN69_09270 [Gemmobacter aquarius]
MDMKKIALAFGIALFLSACAGGEPATRSIGVEGLTIASQGGPMPQHAPRVPPQGPAVMAAKYAVQDVQVVVPRTLKVSEANTFKPRADIVWHGDPTGDRYAQVGAILMAAVTDATMPMVEGRPVTVELTLTKFHALTEKTRYTIGGTHELRFDLVVRDAATGDVLDGPRRIVADTKGTGGAQAIADDAAGRTQKVVITERLAQVLRRELSAPVTDPTLVARARTQSLEPLILTR